MLRLLTARPLLRSSFATPLKASAAIKHFSVFPARRVFEPFGVKQPPGYIVGTVNDAVKLNKPDRLHGPYHWMYERLNIIAFVPLVVYALANGSLPPVADAALGVLMISHCHTGFGACITDYFPPRLFPKISPLFFFMLGAGSATALYGLYKLETEDEGVVGAIRTLWNA